jgi:hypothetical protein
MSDNLINRAACKAATFVDKERGMSRGHSMRRCMLGKILLDKLSYMFEERNPPLL